MSMPTLVSLQICCMLLRINNIINCVSINFIAPESDSADIMTEKEPPGISIGGSSPTGITIAAVLGVIVIVGILLGIAVLGAVLHRRVRKQSRVSTKSAFSLQNTTVIGK